MSASRPPSPKLQTDGQDRRKQVNIFTLPSQKETLELIQRYFSNTGLLFPYIYPPVFLDTYHQMVRENFSRVRKTWLGLLNMMLAMATITEIPGGATAGARIKESDVFYQRGLGLCGSEILRGTTLEVGELLIGGLVENMFNQSTYSAIFAPDGAISSRHAKIHSSMDCSWISGQGCSSAWITFAECIKVIFTY